MNNDLISRSALLAEIRCLHEFCGMIDAFGLWATEKAREIIKAAPAVDAVEVVRCRDCIHYQYGEIFKDIKFCSRLTHKGKPMRYPFSAEAFCSYGERRNDGT